MKKPFYQNKLSTFIFFIAISSLFLSAENFSPYSYRPDPNQLSDYQKNKKDLCEQVYQNICKTIKDMRKAPTFNFVYNYKGKPYLNAYYSPSNNTINFGEGIYDLATRFGEDSINVIAVVMGHEIAHFYKDHGWAHAFGKANSDADIQENVKKSMYDSDDRARMEAEADYYGGIFGYLTGYNSLSVGADFFDTLYTALEIPEETFGYPSRKDRMRIYDNSKEMLEKLVPVFETANLLTLVRRYQQASICYDYISTTFPSREIYNNAGVALANEAVALFEAEEIKYVYPFGLDFDTRLNNAGTKGVGESKTEKRIRLLKEAITSFNDAIRIDEEYAAAYINSALAHTLLGEHDMALGLAAKAISKSTNNSLLAANAHIAKGIAYANKNEKGAAKEEFKLAVEGNPLIANENLEAATNNVFAKIFKKKGPSEEISGAEESIADLGVEVMEALFDDRDDFKVTSIAKQTDDRPETILIAVEEEDFNAILVATYKGKYSTKEELEGFLVTKPNYKGKTTRGIKLGSSFEEIEKMYGKPSRILSGSQSNFLYYEQTSIVFMLDANQKVTQWMLYGKIK